MENELEASGFAADISLDMLSSCDHFSRVLGCEKLPKRICCDAYNLPIATGSIPFAFCYQTLHHFPDPAPIIAEIHRVLAPGGYFFFDEEPYRKSLHVNLYRSKMLYSQDALAAGKLRKGLDYFLARTDTNEVRHGVMENEEISLKAWRRALAPFAAKDIHLRSLKGLGADLSAGRRSLSARLVCLLGGNITGLCQKAGDRGNANAIGSRILICPDCREARTEIVLKLLQEGLYCKTCGLLFPEVSGVQVLLTRPKLSALYPDIA
jgi:SAM-dependent methyltransferase